MRERPIGSSGLVVSVVGLGCNNFGWRVDSGGARAVVDAAIDAGVTLFDTAESYGDGESEVFLGRAVAERRDEVAIATKFGWGRGRDDHEVARGAPDAVRSSLDGSLRRLGTDYVDLYQYHRPDGFTPIEETLGVLNELVAEGKVRHVGSSNLSADQVREAARVAREHGLAPFVSAQNRYSLLEREAEDDLLPACAELGIGFIPYFPLARGLLTGKYRRGEEAPEGTRLAGALDVPEETWGRIDALETFARDQGVGLLEVAIGGLAAQPGVSSVIAGATTVEQVRANAAAGAWEPSEAALAELARIR